MKKEWFGEWFNSPYYHILYKNRDNAEARKFIDNLTAHLKITTEHQLMDLACGKGRHAIYLNKQGFDVTGLDLSDENIKHARQFANDKLHFEVHDMRLPFEHQKFDFIFNLFTSFGYFETTHEHEVAIKSVARALKPKGKLILDFFNTYKVINDLKPHEIKKVDGIEFNIEKQLSDAGYIIKDIHFTYEGEQYHFTEKVKAIKRIDFLEFFKKAELKVVNVFGDYDLSPYTAEQSERMIFIVEKI
ncbi:class I SAM-dependent methyltransferase [Fulvivirga lutimaris]|uniref:class I SAM-dependent methyltransferase n=1 Tax=Fulvivirga lutimaris TaxID=1819566 RepID=UPI0012BB6C30|nr:class I SAM-dependent methyltransferase [Fulvivirga lutimaris]MTI40970.1 class I SAM-dependent methyltransferase [Fulvivirga lutimaris]